MIGRLALVAVCVLGTVVIGRRAARASAVASAATLAGHQRAWLPAATERRVSASLARAGVELDAMDAVRLWLVAALAATVVGAAMAPMLGVLAGAAVVCGAPMALLAARRRGDGLAIAALPEVLDRWCASVRAGLGPGEALDDLCDVRGPLAGDLHRLASRRALGIEVERALDLWAEERPAVEVRAASRSLRLALEVGGGAAAALEGLSTSLRMHEGARNEARSLSAQTRVSAWVVALAPLAFFAFSAITDPGSLGVMASSGGGRLCLVLGLALELAGVATMRALLASVA
jgi:tight adherence protein B